MRLGESGGKGQTFQLTSCFIEEDFDGIMAPFRQLFLQLEGSYENVQITFHRGRGGGAQPFFKTKDENGTARFETLIAIPQIPLLIDICGQCYETFYGRKLRLFRISVSSQQALLAQSNICTRVGSRPCPQTVDYSGKVCQGQTLQLITKVRKLRT